MREEEYALGEFVLTYTFPPIVTAGFEPLIVGIVKALVPVPVELKALMLPLIFTLAPEIVRF
jgi:hypothetical protein